MELLREAASWLPKLLRVQPAGPSRLVLPLPPDVDPEWVGCGDLELPRGWRGLAACTIHSSPLRGMNGCRNESGDGGREMHGGGAF